MITTKTTKQGYKTGEDVDTSASADQSILAASALRKPVDGTTTPKVSARLDQWADGPVSEGDLDGGAGRTQQEVFVNGNLNAQKAHYNEGDAIPYRAILDDLTPGVVYGLEIQWDTVDSGAYALDYLTGYNFSFEDSRHPGEPDVTPTAGISDLSSGTFETVDIPSDPRLLEGFGSQFGITDGLSSGQPSGPQEITIFGAVDSLSTSPITYNADFTKASITVYFTYTGSATDTEDSVVVAWGGHIASSADWRDDAGETVETASDISGSPYHMRLLSLYENGIRTSIGNQDRSLSADAVVFVSEPGIQIEKTPDQTIIDEGGESVTYTYVVTNTGNSPLAISALKDDNGTPLDQTDDIDLLTSGTFIGGDADNDNKLDTSETWTYTYATSLVLDGNEGHTNTATATGQDDFGNTVTDTDDATVTGQDLPPEVTLVKKANGEDVEATINEGGAQVVYTYEVTNTSSASTDNALSITTLVDDNGTPADNSDDLAIVSNGVLQSGFTLDKNGGDQDDLLETEETWIYTYTNTNLVLAGGGSVLNTASVTAVDDEGTSDTDQDTATVTAQDVPDIQILSIAVDEDFLAVGNQDQPAPSTGDDTGLASQSGNFPVDFGADSNGATISFAALHGLDVKETKGTTDPSDDTQVRISDGDIGLKYFWDAGTATLYGATDVTNATTAANTAAFKLEVTNPTSTNSTAPYVFTLLEGLEHAPGTGTEDNTENPNILITLDYLATDSTGDQATGSINITVDDDIPERKAGATPIEGSVEEDGMSAAVTADEGLDGLDQSEGNRDAAGDSTTDDEAASTTTTSLASLVSVGADEPPTFSLSDITTGLPQLYSKGVAISYAVTHPAGQTHDLLTATAGTRTVFTLQVNRDGTWAFDLDDQLDHVAGNGENYSLRSGATGTDTVDKIDFSSIIQVTDADGDTLSPLAANDFSVKVQDDIPLPLDPGDLTVSNSALQNASAALGYAGKVGADEPGSVSFVGTDGAVLQGTIQDSTPTAENLKSGGSDIYLFGFGTGTLTATTDSDASDGLDSAKTVFQMTLNPETDTYGIALSKSIDALVDVEFGNVVARVPSGNPSSLIVDNIGGSTIDALFTGFDSAGITTVNVSGAGVGVGNGQDFSNQDRMRIEFLEDDGDGILETGEAETVNRFTFVMNQNNPPADDGDALIRVYDPSGNEVQITGILVNGQTLVGTGGAPVPSNDGGNVTATADGKGFELHGLGGGTAGSSADNDTITIITASGYNRIDITGIGTDTNKDTFDILLKSVAVPTPFDITFAVQADLTDEDGDGTTPVNLDVTLDAGGASSGVALLGVNSMQQDLIA